MIELEDGGVVCVQAVVAIRHIKVGDGPGHSPGGVVHMVGGSTLFVNQQEFDRVKEAAVKYWKAFNYTTVTTVGV